MSQQPHAPSPPFSSESQRSTLAKLQRIYGRSSVAPDVFGRRPALPSEIERLARREQKSPGLPAQPSKARHQRQKKCG